MQILFLKVKALFLKVIILFLNVYRSRISRHLFTLHFLIASADLAADAFLQAQTTLFPEEDYG